MPKPILAVPAIIDFQWEKQAVAVGVGLPSWNLIPYVVMCPIVTGKSGDFLRVFVGHFAWQDLSLTYLDLLEIPPSRLWQAASSVSRFGADTALTEPPAVPTGGGGFRR